MSFQVMDNLWRHEKTKRMVFHDTMMNRLVPKRKQLAESDKNIKYGKLNLSNIFTDKYFCAELGSKRSGSFRSFKTECALRQHTVDVHAQHFMLNRYRSIS